MFLTSSSLEISKFPIERKTPNFPVSMAGFILEDVYSKASGFSWISSINTGNKAN